MIADVIRRKVAFCKRRRGLLKKVIEMSTMCNKRIVMILFDPEKDKAIQFQSDESFKLSEAVATVDKLRKQNAVEYYSNKDYQMLGEVDLRTVRNQKLVNELEESEFNLSEQESSHEKIDYKRRRFGESNSKKENDKKQSPDTA